MSPAALGRLPGVLKDIFHTIDPICKPTHFATRFSIFRGDSFQLIAEPKCAISALLIIRAGLRAAYPAPLSKAVDARIGIAIGEVNNLAKNITESNGVAFNLSGRLLEELKSPRLSGFVSENTKTNREWNVAFNLAEYIIRRWTTAQSILVPFLLQGMNQMEVAVATNARQPTIGAKIQAMGWEAIMQWKQYCDEQQKERGNFLAGGINE